MKTLHLHAGLHRTGTTSIQFALRDDPAALAASGIALAPGHDAALAHNPLAVAARREGADALLAPLLAVAGTPGPERLVFSAEELSTTLLDAGLARRIADALRGAFEVRLHLCLRRQDFLLESIFAQLAKTGRRQRIDQVAYDLDLAGRVDALAEAFGADALCLSVYRDDRREDRLAPFLTALGLDPQAFRRPGPVNQGLSRREALAMARFRVRTPALKAGKRRIAEAMLRARPLVADGRRFVMSPDARRALMDRHREGNARLAVRHGLSNDDAGWLTAELSAEPEWTPAAPPSAGEWLALWAAAARACVGRRAPGGGLPEAARLALQIWEAARSPL